jgi:hypothetical protein
MSSGPSCSACFWELPRSIRRRLRRRAPRWIHEHIVSPYADRLRDIAMDGHRCHHITVPVTPPRRNP